MAGDDAGAEECVPEFAYVYGVLVAVEAAVVEACVGIADAYGERGTRGVWGVAVHEIDVVDAKVTVTEGRVRGHGVACGAGPSKTGVEGGCDGEDAGIGIVEGMDGVAGGLVVPDCDQVAAGIVGA